MSSKLCSHCHGTARHVECERCSREMCEDCISYDGHQYGKVCGLCKDDLEEDRQNNKPPTGTDILGREFITVTAIDGQIMRVINTTVTPGAAARRQARQKLYDQRRSEAMKFATGPIAITPGAESALQDAGQDPMEFLARHIQGDWGELSEEDKEVNEQSLVSGNWLISAYITKKGERIWIITEAGGVGTTILLPDDY